MILVLFACTSLPTGGLNASPKLLSTPSYTLTGANYFASFGSAAAGGFDLNGDTVDDFVVGARQDAGFAGAAYVYSGSASGPTLTLSLAAPDPHGYYFGGAVAGGDLNGDGFDDLVISASTAGSNYEGYVYVFYGSSSGIAATPDLTIAGTASQQLGFSLAVGDTDGDGYDDVAVGAPYDGSYGYVGLFQGTVNGLDSTPSLTVVGSQSAIGYDVALGDLDGDGKAELVIGEPGYNAAAGQVQVLQSSTGNWLTIPGTQGGEQLGDEMVVAGDLNGDGYNDLAVSSTYGSTFDGQLDIFLGGSSIGTSTVATVHGLASGSARHLGAPGDVDGDGKADVLLGGSGYDSGRGYAELWSGAKTGLASAATLSLYGTAVSDGFGNAVGNAGDVNGDGLNDYFVAASAGAAGYGEVQIFSGDPVSLDTGGDTAVDTADTAVDTGVDTGDTSVDTGDTSVDTADTSVDTGDTSVDTADTSVDTGDTSVDTGDTSVDTADTSVDTGDTSTDTDETGTGDSDSENTNDSGTGDSDSGKTEEGCGGCHSGEGSLSLLLAMAAGAGLVTRRRQPGQSLPASQD